MAVINLIKKKGINPQTKTTLYFPQWTRRSTDTAMELAEEMVGSCRILQGDSRLNELNVEQPADG